MSSRTSIRQFISAGEPAGVQIGDEWYSTTNSLLYKRTLVSGNIGWLSITPTPNTGDATKLPLTGGTLTSTNSTATLVISDTGASGGNIRLTGNDVATPNKTIRSFNGNFEVINNAYSSAIMVLTDAGALTCSGNVTAFSDETLKTDWKELPGNFIEQLSLIKHGTYTRTDSGERQVGIGAQSLQPLLPEAVMKSGEYLSVAYGNAAMVSAVELAKVVVSQQDRISKLEEIIKQLVDKYNKEST